MQCEMICPGCYIASCKKSDHPTAVWKPGKPTELWRGSPIFSPFSWIKTDKWCWNLEGTGDHIHLHFHLWQDCQKAKYHQLRLCISKPFLETCWDNPCWNNSWWLARVHPNMRIIWGDGSQKDILKEPQFIDNQPIQSCIKYHKVAMFAENYHETMV